jgi:FGGY-family pentulose kinase
MAGLLVGVDVGTGSARAGVLDMAGRLLGRAEEAIAMRRPDARVAEHDSDDIWRAVGRAVRGALEAAAAGPGDIAAIGFDATCSLVLRAADGGPLPASPDAEARWDTIVWLDHRAMREAAECTATGDPVLETLGGVMSPEMQIPKLMWLQRHAPRSWAGLGAALDLADFLTARATGIGARSRSTLACKWGFGGVAPDAWPDAFLARVGLADLAARAALPAKATAPGTDLGPLTASAADALGLSPATRVAASLVDAHAGALGILGRHATRKDGMPLCLIAGTSNSILALAPDPRPTRGVWGPYAAAILPGAFLLEAGQSATGALLDHIIRWHRAGGEPSAERHRAITERIGVLRVAEGTTFAENLHILPDFHGNRSPLADPSALGVVSGLALDSDFDSLCRLYWKTALAIALGTRQNLETLAARGFAADRLLLGGGHGRNRLLIELYADATGATIMAPNAPDAMLLGSAMLAATAAGLYPSLAAAAAAMDQGATAHRPDPARHAAYGRDYRILLEMQRQRQVLMTI